MSELDGYGDGPCNDSAPDGITPRASRGRRSVVILPSSGQDTDTILRDTVKAAPRRSSIIKVHISYGCGSFIFHSCFTHQKKMNTKYQKEKG